MCGVCGCSPKSQSTDEPLLHHHAHDADRVIVEENLLAKNQQYADANRLYFQENNMTVLNVMSSPGTGKTTLLGETFRALKHTAPMAVIVGDQQTDADAKQLKECGVQALQINTGHVCHLDAHMIGHAMQQLSLPNHAILFIENVGNLVCPANFDLGEAQKIVMLSVTEGDNKPLKYPGMFREANLILFTKLDLLPYVQFNLNQCEEYVRRINPDVHTIGLSTISGEGMDEWHQWIYSIMDNQSFS